MSFDRVEIPGGTGKTEDQVIFNFTSDAVGGHSMLDTAENVACKYGISTAEQHDVVPRRYAQYQAALADDYRGFGPLECVRS